MECDLLRNAYRIAEIYSDDPHTKNGAVLVSRHGEVIGSGANSLPIGVETRTVWPAEEIQLHRTRRV